MARERELVQEFQGIITDLIDRQVDEAQNGIKGIRRSWLGYDETVEAEGLRFTSVLGAKGRFLQFSFCGREERMWEVALRGERRIGEYAGWLSVATFESRPDQMTRNWSFKSGMQMIDPSTNKTLATAEEMEDVLAWVKSPTTSHENLARLAVLGQDEIALVDPQLAELAATGSQMRDDLASLAQARRRPMPDVRVN